MFVRPLRRLLGRPFAISYFHTTPTSWASRKVIQRFNLADIGEGITECEVIKWSVRPMAKIQAFDPLCEVQSDKASVEITSPFEGVVKELLVQEGEVAKVGSGLCLIEIEEEVDEGVDSAVLEPPVRPSQVHQTPSLSMDRSTAPDQVVVSGRAPAPDSRGLHPLDPNYAPKVGVGAHEKDVLAAPSVRHFARRNGVDLALLMPGSGNGGRVEKQDVEAFLSKASEPNSAQQPAEKDVVVELGRTRYGMWKAMVKSLEVPHFGYSTTLDLTSLYNLLPALNAHIPAHVLPPPTTPQPILPVNPSALYPAPTPAQVPESQQYTRLTYLPILLKTLSRAMLEWPLLRSSITPFPADAPPSSKPTLTIRPHADISIALSTPTGLYTPTLQHVDTSSIYTLASRLKHLSYLGRQTPCGFTPAEMPKRGGTISVSNIGGIGAGDFASPVLVPGGGVAIVVLGRAKWVWDVDRGDGKGERRLKMGVSWSADHRVVEGAELAAFVESWRGYVEAPERLIADSV
ncbi:CoA-dependent acyltransferase [Tricholoma matsutake]|nr:CoA-dependent acyltransferase [Tricholoma matsutake 945]